MAARARIELLASPSDQNNQQREETTCRSGTVSANCTSCEKLKQHQVKKTDNSTDTWAKDTIGISPEKTHDGQQVREKNNGHGRPQGDAGKQRGHCLLLKCCYPQDIRAGARAEGALATVGRRDTSKLGPESSLQAPGRLRSKRAMTQQLRNAQTGAPDPCSRGSVLSSKVEGPARCPRRTGGWRKGGLHAQGRILKLHRGQLLGMACTAWEALCHVKSDHTTGSHSHLPPKGTGVGSPGLKALTAWETGWGHQEGCGGLRDTGGRGPDRSGVEP